MSHLAHCSEIKWLGTTCQEDRARYACSWSPCSSSGWSTQLTRTSTVLGPQKTVRVREDTPHRNQYFLTTPQEQFPRSQQGNAHYKSHHTGNPPAINRSSIPDATNLWGVIFTFSGSATEISLLSGFRNQGSMLEINIRSNFHAVRTL